MIPITVEAVGMELLAARFRREVRHFQAEQRKQMRKAGNLVKREVVRKLRSGSPLKSGTHPGRKDSKGREIGPLYRKIRLRVFKTTTDVGARIEPNRRAFYGRFHETGLSASYVTKTDKVVFFGGGFRRIKAGTRINLNLPRRPFLEPVARSTEGRVVEIMGDSYNVFYRGGA